MRSPFSNLNALSYPAAKAYVKLINTRYMWLDLQKDAHKRVRECSVRQQSKVNSHPNSPVEVFPQPDARFVHVHTGLVGSSPRPDGLNYLFTCIDR